MRQWTCQRGVLYVVTGPLYERTPVECIAYDEDGDGKDDNGILVDVPTHFFKFAYDPHNVEAIAFILPNRKLKTLDPDGAREVHLPPLREDLAAAGAVPPDAQGLGGSQPSGDHRVREVRPAPAAEPAARPLRARGGRSQ